MAPDVRPKAEYSNEQRIAVVMYGGVSLAVYIAGVAKELLGIVRASARGREDGTKAALSSGEQGELKGVEQIYRKLAQWDPASGKSPLESADDAPLRTRFVIDVISGTSAGGINGVFLARALAENRTIDAVSDLWINQGDISTLLNDRGSLAGITGLTQQKPPVALLNGERMYRMLLDAFGAMAPGGSACDPGDRVDLYVTTTDVRGEIVRIPLANGYATEKRYRQAFHFCYEPAADRNDFADAKKAQLAFAARCTSSFPFAFEPFTWSDAARLSGVSDDTWTDNLLYHSGDYARRPLCDGGYLDNKPFSYVCDEMAKRHSELPAGRTLFYVEPDPQALDEASHRSLQEKKPDPIENVLQALSLPGYETIREDIERVLRRNDRVDTLQELTSTVEGFIAANPDRAKRSAVQQQGLSYHAYHIIKVNSVKDWFAELVCTASHIGEARLEQVIRELVERWVDVAYRSTHGDDQFLLDLDFGYRMRKIAFLLRRGQARSSCVVELKKLYDRVYALQRIMRDRIAVGAQKLFASRRDGLEAVSRLHDPKARAAALDELFASLRGAAGGVNLDSLNDLIANEMRPQMRDLAHQLTKILSVPDAEKLRLDCEAFEQYDVVLFPLMRAGEVGEPVHVDVVRISPLDVATGGGVSKLAGTKLAHFGAFLESDWRRNDILWGRMDAAESLIRQMMQRAKEDVSEELIKSVVAAAHEAIIDDLCAELSKRLTANATAQRAVTLTPQQERQLKAAADAKLQDKGAMVDYFAAGQGYDRDIDVAQQAQNASRAGVIVDKVLENVVDQNGGTFPRAIGSVLSFVWGLVQISIPGSVVRTVFSHLGKIAFLLFALLAVGGMFFNAPEVRSLGITGVAAVIGIAFVSSLLADWFRGRLSLHWRAAFEAIGLFLILAALFVLVVTAKGEWKEVPHWLAQVWNPTHTWLAKLEATPLPRGVIYVMEVAILSLGVALSKFAIRASRRLQTAPGN